MQPLLDRASWNCLKSDADASEVYYGKDEHAPLPLFATPLAIKYINWIKVVELELIVSGQITPYLWAGRHFSSSTRSYEPYLVEWINYPRLGM